jgi:hypothetical protein
MSVPFRRAPRFVFLSSNAGVDVPDEVSYGWRLVAANNRPLGRGPVNEASLDLCSAAAAELRRQLSDVETTVVTDPRLGVWTWRVTLRGELMAVSVHPYLRRVESARGLSQFIAGVALADPADGVVRHFGPHSPRGDLSGAQATSAPR